MSDGTMSCEVYLRERGKADVSLGTHSLAARQCVKGARIDLHGYEHRRFTVIDTSHYLRGQSETSELKTIKLYVKELTAL